MKLKVHTQPATEPVTADEAKTALSIDGTARDTQITAAIIAARQEIEAYTNRALITQTLEVAFDELPDDIVELPRPVLQSITSVTHYDDASTATVVNAANYHVDTYGEPGGFALNTDSEWPTGTPRTTNTLIVRYVAGYGAASDVPRALREAVIEMVRSMIDGDPDAEARAKRFAKPYRIVQI